MVHPLLARTGQQPLKATIPTGSWQLTGLLHAMTTILLKSLFDTASAHRQVVDTL